MTDVVVTVPKDLWEAWLDEGDLPGQPWSRNEYSFYCYGAVPEIAVGERVYVVAWGRLRGYAPLTRIEKESPFTVGRFALVRRGRAVACTIDEPIRGFRGWRNVWWDRAAEHEFPAWASEGVGDR